MNLDFAEDDELGGIAEIERWAAWTLIALCHDLGYPLEKAHKVTEKVDRMMEFFGNVSTGRYRYSFQVHHQSLIDIMLRAVASRLQRVDTSREAVNVSEEGEREPIFTTVIQPKYYAKFSHSFEQFQHGIISVLVLLKSLVYFMEMDFDFSGRGSLKKEDARQFHIRREILRSIACHTCPEVYHLKLNTPSFLLIVCDDLQEWGRPTMAGMRSRPSAVSEPPDGDTKVYVKSADSNRLACRIVYHAHGKTEEKIKSEFRRYHKLLRAALGDNRRKFEFCWQIECFDNTRQQRVTLLFHYDSSKPPFRELTVKRNGEVRTPLLFDDSLSSFVPADHQAPGLSQI